MSRSIWSSVLSIFALLVLSGVVAYCYWQFQMNSYTGKIDLDERIEISRLARELASAHKMGLLMELDHDRVVGINSPELVTILRKHSDFAWFDEPRALRNHLENGIHDRNSRPLRIFVFQDGEPILFDEMKEIAISFRIAVWSKGNNQIDEFGAGDDVFAGVTGNNELLPAPNRRVALMRHGLESYVSFPR